MPGLKIKDEKELHFQLCILAKGPNHDVTNEPSCIANFVNNYEFSENFTHISRYVVVLI